MSKKETFQCVSFEVLIDGHTYGDLVDFGCSEGGEGWHLDAILAALLEEVIPDHFLDEPLDIYFRPCEITIYFGRKPSQRGFDERAHFLSEVQW